MSLLYGQSIGAGPGTLVGATPSVPWLGLQFRAEDAGVLYSRTFAARGIPLPLWAWNTTSPDQVTGLGIMAAGVKNWMQWLSGTAIPGVGGAGGVPAPIGQWCGRARLTTQGSMQTTKILSVASAAKGQPWQITLTAPLPLAVGTVFAITRCRGQGTSGLNGHATVTSIQTPGTAIEHGRRWHRILAEIGEESIIRSFPSAHVFEECSNNSFFSICCATA